MNKLEWLKEEIGKMTGPTMLTSEGNRREVRVNDTIRSLTGPRHFMKVVSVGSGNVVAWRTGHSTVINPDHWQIVEPLMSIDEFEANLAARRELAGEVEL